MMVRDDWEAVFSDEIMETVDISDCCYIIFNGSLRPNA